MKENTEIIITLMFAFALLGLFFWLGYMYAQDKFKVENKIEELEIQDNSVSFWIQNEDNWKNFVCVGDIYIGGNKIKESKIVWDRVLTPEEIRGTNR